MKQSDTEMNRQICEMIRRKKNVYKIDPDEILSAYRREMEDIEGYHGRELLELLQNAVDELAAAKDKFVCIELTGNTLTFSNNGSAFTKGGITSLMYTNLSPKFKDHKYIGNKGTGFRSVLNWADYIRIYSGSLSVEFSADSAAEFLKDLLNTESVLNYKREHPDLRVATLVAPKVIEPLDQKTFDTVIEIKVKDNMLESVREQMHSLNATTLLFLDNIQSLAMTCDGKCIEYRKSGSSENDEVNNIVIETYTDDIKTSSDEWEVAVRKGETGDQRYTVAVAYKPDMSVQPDVLYSYFKTKVAFPVPALVHGTFELDGNRNHLNETPLNQRVLEEACRLLIDVTKKMCSLEVNYAPLKLLALRTDFPNELSWARLTDFYLDAVSESNVFPNVNESYISFSADTKFYKSNISDYLKGENFNHLLIHSKDTAVVGFIEKLAKQKNISLRYEYDYISAAINQLLPNTSASERAALCLNFLDEYNTEVIANPAPQFMLDSSGKTVLHNQQVFLPPEAMKRDFSQPPDFAQLVFMNRDLLAAFRDVAGINYNLRMLSDRLEKLNVNEYGLTEIIRSVVSKFNSREDKERKDRQRDCVELISWLWKLYKGRHLDSIDVSGFNFRIPILTREKEIVNTDTLYLGDDYGNDVTEKLFAEKENIFVAESSAFNVLPDDIPQFCDFLKKLAIAEFPRISIKEIGPPTNEYKERLIADFVYPIKVSNSTAENTICDEWEARNAAFHQMKVAVIECYDHILKNVRTEHVLEWLRADDSARALVTAQYETNPDSRGSMTYGYQQNVRYFPGNKLSCFMRYEFSHIPWIDIDGERFAPDKCLLQGGIGKTLSPFAVVPDFTVFVKNLNKSATEISKIKTILSEIGAAETYGDLSTDSLYGILLKLPAIDSSGEISKSLYKAVIDARDSIIIDEKNKHYIDFMSGGKVFCKNTRSYEHITDAWYMTEKGASDTVLKDYKLIAIPSRQSQENILRYFGVKSLKLKGKVVGEPPIHELNKTFAEDFYNFKKYAFCYRCNYAKQPEISAVKTLKIILCKTIMANYDKGDVLFNDYDFIRGSNGNIYVKMPLGVKSMDMARMDLEFCRTIAEIFTSVIDIHESNLLSCLRSLYREREVGRQKLIIQDFDDLHILTEAGRILEHTQSYQDMFMNACEQIGGSEVMPLISNCVTKINFENRYGIENSEVFLVILKVLGINVPEFNERSEFDIDLRPYFHKHIDRLMEEQKTAYKNALYTRCAESGIEEKKKFIEYLEEYQNHTYPLENSITVDADKVFFGCWNILSEPIDVEVDADAQWKENREIFLDGRNVVVLNDLLTVRENESLLYFGELEILSERYATRAAEWKRQEENESAIRNPQSKQEISIQVIATTAAPVNTRTRKYGTGNRSAGMKREWDKESWGRFAEKIVYEKLREQYNNVEWISENAKKEGVNPEGVGGKGYDLIYKDANDETIFVEIKSTAGADISFIITAGELNAAEEKGDKYVIALVVNVADDNKRKLLLLPNLFVYHDGETRFDNSKFTLSADNYSVSCLLS